jgi:hypothetical protein
MPFYPHVLLLTPEDNILEATLPVLPEHEKETPAGFTQIGHVGKAYVIESLQPTWR